MAKKEHYSKVLLSFNLAQKWHKVVNPWINESEVISIISHYWYKKIWIEGSTTPISGGSERCLVSGWGKKKKKTIIQRGTLESNGTK